MPFGTRDPFKYTKVGRRVIPFEAGKCSVCDRDLAAKNGIWPVAPCFVPVSDNTDEEPVAIFGCLGCYQAQRKLLFTRVQDLIDHRRKPKVVKPKIKKLPHEFRKLAKSHDGPEVVISNALSLVNELSGATLCKVPRELLEPLKSLYESLGVLLQSQAENDTPLCQVLGSPDEPDSDDIEFGMTDEQRARMDAAVQSASNRTFEVPQEVPSGW